ncbi:MAG TPA: DUF2269 family protein [Solirubrobacterales bacterium]|nr:DUF2269 family protein [Solirubrobacterales bacterium]
MIFGTITFYWCVVFVHVMAVVIGFGATFVYPVFLGVARRRYPRVLPYLLGTMDKLGKVVIGPSSLLILASGIYLVADGPYKADASFVQVAAPILIALIFIGPLYFGRTEARLAEIAARDVGASAGEDVSLSPELETGLGRLTTNIRLANLAVLVALFFMVVKP